MTSRRMVNEQIDAENLPSEPVMHAHPDSVAGCGYSDGDPVLVESCAGCVRTRLFQLPASILPLRGRMEVMLAGVSMSR
ncbi:MAG: hypothetical protein AB1486_02160 [Planctomycetota bacterium]